MEKKLFDASLITLDGRMDEPVWDQVEEYTNFTDLETCGGGLSTQQTFFKIIPCVDRIYFGIKCIERQMPYVTEIMNIWDSWCSNSVELFFSPDGNPKTYYQFFFSVNGNKTQCYFEEGGHTQPDKYMPEYRSEVYRGEDFWSVEVEIPLTAFYMTPASTWADQWLFNVTRCRRVIVEDEAKDKQTIYFSTWSKQIKNFREMERFNKMGGFPSAPKEDDVHVSFASVEMTDQHADGYSGIMTVKAVSAVDGTYEFSSDRAETTIVTLKAGHNTFTVPCFYPECIRFKTKFTLKRLTDGKEFIRYYPVRVEYEPVRVSFTLPEFRANFYPGQDYSKVVGKVVSRKAVTLKLEGPGIETQVLTPDADGNFTFETPNFEYGDAFLTASIEGYEVKKKIRRLAPTGKTMTWISGGNLIVNGKPYLRRNMYSPHYRTGEYCDRLYATENIHESEETKTYMAILPHFIDKSCERAGGEATLDGTFSEKMKKAFDEILEKAKDKDFTHYYLTDEPDLRDLSPIYFKNIYEYFAEKDPYHVIWISIRDAADFIECADWFDTDPYLHIVEDESGKRHYTRPINMIGRYVDTLASLNRSDKCIGLFPTCFAFKEYNPCAAYPTFDELNAHSWAGMIHGGKSLCAYVCYDLYDRSSLHEGISYVFESFEVLDQLVLHGKRTVLFKNDAIDSVLYDKGDEQMFVLVNMTEHPQKVTLDKLSGQWYNFRKGGMITNNTFELQPFEVIIGTSQVKDAGLATYAETAALIDKNEYERTHTGNLLFGREADIPYIASAPFPLVSPYKLFDGVKKNYAWEAKGDNRFIELDLTKVKPNFSKLVVHGYNLDNMDAFIKTNGEQNPLAYVEKKEEEFDVTYILKNAITPDALRLEFNTTAKSTQLYEIEMF